MIFIMTFLITSIIVGYATKNIGMVQFSLGFLLAYSILRAFDKFLQLIIEHKESKCASKEK